MATDRGNLVRLGQFIRRRRSELGRTQSQRGRRIGYYQERISALERGSYGLPSLNAMAELADALECEIIDLLEASGFVSRALTGWETVRPFAASATVDPVE